MTKCLEPGTWCSSVVAGDEAETWSETEGAWAWCGDEVGCFVCLVG